MAAARSKGQNDTAQRILDVAERLVQSRGFNGFSYANVAAELNITTASLRVPDAPAKLAAYASLYADVLRGERMCLCGILAAEYDTLPDAMREAVVRFFDENEVWLAGVLAEGNADQTLSFDGSSRDAAQTILSGLEGAMLVTRPYGDMARFDAAAARLLAGLSK
jgi:TetR/AcrR family transcriptional repressor of nem operon